MSFRKYANCQIIEVKTSKTKMDPISLPGEGFSKFASIDDTGSTDDGYLYVKTIAIASKVNKNNDGWPSGELAKGYKTFIGRPNFVDHNNNDPQRARGVIIDSRLIVDDEKTSSLDPYYSSAPAVHLPPTTIETISEVDAKTFPKLAKAIRSGKIDSVSMGANIELSVCSVCDNKATSPSGYCKHIKSKGAEFEITADNGDKIKKKAYEDCYGVNFFEQSFVFDPAEVAALISDVSDKKITAKVGSTIKQSSKWMALSLIDDVLPVLGVGGKGKAKDNLGSDLLSLKGDGDEEDTPSMDLVCPECGAINEQANPLETCENCDASLAIPLPDKDEGDKESAYKQSGKWMALSLIDDIAPALGLGGKSKGLPGAAVDAAGGMGGSDNHSYRAPLVCPSCGTVHPDASPSDNCINCNEGLGQPYRESRKQATLPMQTYEDYPGVHDQEELASRAPGDWRVNHPGVNVDKLAQDLGLVPQDGKWASADKLWNSDEVVAYAKKKGLLKGSSNVEEGPTTLESTPIFWAENPDGSITIEASAIQTGGLYGRAFYEQRDGKIYVQFASGDPKKYAREQKGVIIDQIVDFYNSEGLQCRGIVTTKLAAGSKTDVDKSQRELDDEDKAKNDWTDETNQDKKPKVTVPDSEKPTAPEKVDTLEDDLLCPICDSDSLQEDPDGIWRCPTCDYELPPDGFRAPDTEKAREMDLRQEVGEKPNEEGENETNVNGEQGESEKESEDDQVQFPDKKKKKPFMTPMKPVGPVSKTINSTNTEEVIDEMKWNTRKANVDFIVNFLAYKQKTGALEPGLQDETFLCREIVRSYGMPKFAKAKITKVEAAAAIEKFFRKEAKTVTVEAGPEGAVTPIHNGFIGGVEKLVYAFRKPDGNAMIALSDVTFSVEISQEYWDMKVPSGVSKGLTRSGNIVSLNAAEENAGMRGIKLGTYAAEAQGIPQQSIPITISVPTDPMKMTEIIAALLQCAQAQEAIKDLPSGEDIIPQIKSIAKEMLLPKAMKLASTQKPIKSLGIKSAPTSKGERVMKDQLKPVEADRRVIKREEIGEDGVHRTEQIIEESDQMSFSEDQQPQQQQAQPEPQPEPQQEEAPKEEEESNEPSQQWSRSRDEEDSKESKLLQALAVAKLAVKMGMILERDEFSFTADLEKKSDKEIKAIHETLERVKSAGLSKAATRRVQEVVPSAPRLGHISRINEQIQLTELDDNYIAQIFM